MSLSTRGRSIFALLGFIPVALAIPCKNVFHVIIGIQKKREIRTCYLSHTPSLRTCHLVKISNFEAHADMNIDSPKGKTYNHIPRTSTVAASATRFPSVRSLECSDERLSKRLSQYVVTLFPPDARLG